MKQQDSWTIFKDSFTKAQKGAIMVSLLILHKEDRHPKEAEFLAQTAQFLDIDLSDPILSTFFQKGKAYIISTLNSLDSGQKEWYIFTIHGMAQVSGNEAKVNYAFGMGENIGMSEEQAIQIVEKVFLLQKKYFPK